MTVRSAQRSPSEPSTAPRVLVVMDVDGTMLTNGNALSVEFRRAFQEVTGVDVAGLRIEFAGSTDRRIVRDFMTASGLTLEYEATYEQFRQRFIERVSLSYPDHPAPRVYAGVEELLQALHQHPDAALVLGTGNIRETCDIKLKRFGLDQYFPHGGGFGGDHEVRSDAIRAAMEAGRDGYGWDGEAWVVGDTVNDYLAGKEAGAKTLLVGTGKVPLDRLKETGADVVLPDLTDMRAVLEPMGLMLPVERGKE